MGQSLPRCLVRDKGISDSFILQELKARKAPWAFLAFVSSSDTFLSWILHLGNIDQVSSPRLPISPGYIITVLVPKSR